MVVTEGTTGSGTSIPNVVAEAVGDQGLSL